jgi:hypothetical protein
MPADRVFDVLRTLTWGTSAPAPHKYVDRRVVLHEPHARDVPGRSAATSRRESAPNPRLARSVAGGFRRGSRRAPDHMGGLELESETSRFGRSNDCPKFSASIRSSSYQRASSRTSSRSLRSADLQTAISSARAPRDASNGPVGPGRETGESVAALRTTADDQRKVVLRGESWGVVLGHSFWLWSRFSRLGPTGAHTPHQATYAQQSQPPARRPMLERRESR